MRQRGRSPVWWSACGRVPGRFRQPRTEFGGRERAGMPMVTYALIALNVLTFALQMSVGDLQKQLVLWPPAVADGQLYRLVTSAFVHYGATHLLLNMWALYVVGPPLEMLLGRLRFWCPVCVEPAGRVCAGLSADAQCADGGRIGRGVRSFRCHIRGGEAAQPRHALGSSGYRDQLGLHLRCSGGQFPTDQLAGARTSAGWSPAGWSPRLLFTRRGHAGT